MKNYFILVLVLVLSGCGTTSGRLGNLPEIKNSNSAVTVKVARIKAFMAAANGYTVSLNGHDLFGIGSGEFTDFKVNEGEHYIAVKCFGGWSPTWKEDSLKFNAKSGRESYFIIKPNMSCAEINEVNHEAITPHIRNGRHIQL